MRTIAIKVAKGATGASAAAVILGLAACGGGGSNSAGAAGSADDGGGTLPPPSAKLLTCDDSMKTSFKPDSNTSVLLVKAFKKGDPLLLSGTGSQSTPVASNDVCVVKLNVGPGNPGPAAAPSTLTGIGIEVWLPTAQNWNGRVHNIGGGGWAGGTAASLTALAGALRGGGAGGQPLNPAPISMEEGAVSGVTDTGHPNGTGAFTMNPDGTINTAGWTDFADRSLYELAVKSKALATAFYGSAPKRMYWEGGSTGGRQGMKMAQAHPEIYDGINAQYPVVNWTKFIAGAMAYPSIVAMRDLGGNQLSVQQQLTVTNAANASCDQVNGQHLGYILDPSACRYDPTKDAAVLCNGVVGNGVTGANAVTDANIAGACVNLAQAQAMNKYWYGPTRDGTAPDPASDNGWSISTPQGNHMWYGLTRGTLTAGIATDVTNGGPEMQMAMLALGLRNADIATAQFINATASGAPTAQSHGINVGINGWKTLSYSQYADAWTQAVALDPSFGYINTDNADLSAFKARGGKIVTWHGLADSLVPPNGTVNYYNRVALQTAGGNYASLQDFYKVYLVPGAGHASPNGTGNNAANPPSVPEGLMYKLLTAWVEQGQAAPTSIILSSADGQKSQPVCAYPQKAMYMGGAAGDITKAASYACR